MRRVAIVFTGGTISMRFDPAAGGAVPALSGAEIIDATSGLADVADVEAIDWGRVPASHLSFAQILELARLLEGTLGRADIHGAVVVQGTDTIEETAFAFDLLVASTKPVVVTGAMRAADEPGYEGPRNLVHAVRAAASPQLSGTGTTVVMDGAVLPADDAVKAHTSAYGAFRAPNRGPVASVGADGVTLLSRRAARRQLGAVPAAAAEPVDLITATMGMDGRLLRAALAGGMRGVVVAATGAGNTHPDLLAAGVEALGGGIPVVLASRCVAGAASGSYAFPGGGATWVRAGAILAGTLAPAKCRVALALGLGAGLAGDALRDLLRHPDPVPT